MSKEVTYSVVARKNMLKKDDPAKYYAQAQASGDVGLDDIRRMYRTGLFHPGRDLVQPHIAAGG